MVLFLAALGFTLACYTYFVERKLAVNPRYKPVCDINDMVSCTKPMKSKYANLFYVSNAVAAMGYYGLVIVLGLFGLTQLLMLATVAGVLVSAVLAYLLYFKIRTLCVLCTAMYVINGLLFLLTMGYL